MKISSNAAPIFWFFPNTRIIEPETIKAIAAINSSIASGCGIPRTAIDSTIKENFVTFTGRAIAKTVASRTLPIKSSDFMAIDRNYCGLF